MTLIQRSEPEGISFPREEFSDRREEICPREEWGKNNNLSAQHKEIEQHVTWMWNMILSLLHTTAQSLQGSPKAVLPIVPTELNFQDFHDYVCWLKAIFFSLRSFCFHYLRTVWSWRRKTQSRVKAWGWESCGKQVEQLNSPSSSDRPLSLRTTRPPMAPTAASSKRRLSALEAGLMARRGVGSGGCRTVTFTVMP